MHYFKCDIQLDCLLQALVTHLLPACQVRPLRQQLAPWCIVHCTLELYAWYMLHGVKHFVLVKGYATCEHGCRPENKLYTILLMCVQQKYPGMTDVQAVVNACNQSTRNAQTMANYNFLNVETSFTFLVKMLLAWNIRANNCILNLFIFAVLKW